MIGEVMKPDRMLKMPEVMNLTKKSRSALKRDVLEGRFPSPVYTGIRSVAWRYSEIMEWINTRERKGVSDVY